jgi:hypothetical protein
VPATRMVIAGAIVLGVTMGGGLAFLLMAKSKSLDACIIEEMRGQPAVSMPNVQRVCAERLGVHLPDRSNTR